MAGVTEKLYHGDPGLLEFDAVVLDCLPEGAEYAVILDRTCFYPGGGGQPADRGTLGSAPLTGMRERDDGVILHLTAAPVPAGPVHGSVDAARRLDYMSQHTGQHILSRALLETAGIETASVHFGEETTAVEVEAAAVPEETLRAAEALANRIIKENRPVITHVVSPAEAARFPLRKAPPAQDSIRVVEVKGFDWSACGGIHVRSTGEVFLIKILALEKIRGRLRVHAVMGARALHDYDRKTAEIQAISRTLGCAEAEAPSLVEKLSAEVRAQAKELRRLRAEYGKAAAREAVARAGRVGPHLFASALFDGMGQEAPAAFVDAVLSEAGRFAAAACTGAEGFQWIVAHSVENGPDLAALLAPVLAGSGMKGGGKRGRMQGSGKDPAAAAEFLRRVGELLGTAGPGPRSD